MSRRLALAFATAVLVVGGLLWLRSRPERIGDPGVADAQVAAAARSELEPSEVLLTEPAEGIEEEPLESREAIATKEVVAEEDERTFVTISARFVDEDGRPLAGVELAAASIVDSPVGVSDGTGLAELVLDWEDLGGFFPQSCAFVMRGPGRVTLSDTQHFRRPEDRFLGEIPLASGGVVRGRVVDPDGRGVADALVQVIRPVLAESAEREELRVFGGLPARSPRTHTESAGSFVLEGLTEMPVSITAQGKGTFFAISEPVTIVAGETQELGELVVEPAPDDHQIGGIVRTEEGEPVQGAGIRLLPEERGIIHGRVLTDELGGFRFTVVPGRKYALQVLDYSSNGSPDVNLDAIEPGTLDLEIVFEGTRDLLVRVTGPDGRPVRRFEATVRGTDRRVITGGHGVSEDGEPLVLKRPKAAFGVLVVAPGYEYLQKSFDAAEVEDELTLVLEPTVGIAGRVTAGGKPVSGVVVDAHPALQEGRKGLVVDVFHLEVPPRYFMGDRTGADGEFFLNVPQPARLHVHASADGFARADSGLIDFDPAQGDAELVLELSPGGAVEGRVLVGQQEKPSGRTIAMSRGDGHFETAITDAEGAYRFEHLTPGPWQIAEVDGRELEQATGGGLRTVDAGTETQWDLEVVAGETTRFDLDLNDAVACRFEGRFSVDGQEPVSWTWSAFLLGRFNRPFDSGGAFAFDAEEPGTYKFTLNGPRTPGAYCAVTVETELYPGTNEWQGAIETGTLELTGVEAPSLSEIDRGGQIDLAYTLRCQSETGLTWLGNIFAAEDGKLRLLRVPAGRIEVFEGDLSRVIGGPEPTPLLETELAPGEKKTVALD